MKRRWLLLKFELRRLLVCKRRGHALELIRWDSIDIDGIRFYLKCTRCHRRWGPMGFSYTAGAAKPYAREWIKRELEEWMEEVRYQ